MQAGADTIWRHPYKSFAARVAGTQLNSLVLNELSAQSEEEYINNVVKVAQNDEMLASINAQV